MQAIDTNVLVRLITRDEPRQASAAEEFIERGAWVSTLVLMETIWVLDAGYKCNAAQLATAIEMLLNHRSIAIQDAEMVTAALALYRSKPTLGFSDCLILQAARKAGHLPLGTFDRDLGKVDGTTRL